MIKIFFWTLIFNGNVLQGGLTYEQCLNKGADLIGKVDHNLLTCEQEK